MKKDFCLLMIATVLILGIGVFALPQNEVSNQENRPLKTNADISSENIIGSLESVMEDQFYFREEFVTIYYNVKVLINRLFGSENSFTVLTDEVTDIGDSYLINTSIALNEDSISSAASKGYNINEMDLKYPEVKTYVYFPKRIEELISINGQDNYGEKVNQAFIGQLNSGISTDYLKYDSIDEYKYYFFKSDFHWNIKGAYQGYSDIVEMISQDFDIGSPKSIKEEINYDYEFYGNVANKVGKVTDPDYISDYLLDGIADYQYFINGKEMDPDEYKNNYSKAGTVDGTTDYDYYFATYDLMRTYDFNDESKPNILIFGDSFINPIQMWIASHFNKTVVIDLRSNDGTFNLDQIISENDIDIILVCEMYHNLYVNGNMFIPLD